MKRGMTLIELLIVIAIMAVMAGVSMNVLMKARQRVYVTACISNLRQLVQAVHMYEDDWETVPVEKVIKTPEGYYGKARQMLDPYVRSEEVFLCPADFTRGRLGYSESFTMDAFGNLVPYADPQNPNPDSVPWKGRWWLTSYSYLIDFSTVQIYGKGSTRLQPRCPLFSCYWHCPILRADVIARYDGSIEIARSVESYRLLFEGVDGK